MRRSAQGWGPLEPASGPWSCQSLTARVNEAAAYGWRERRSGWGVESEFCLLEKRIKMKLKLKTNRENKTYEGYTTASLGIPNH